MPKNYDEIYECTCPFCGKVGKLLNKSTHKPEFYCTTDKVWFQYKKVSVFDWKILLSRDKYQFKGYNKSEYCEKHNIAYDCKSYGTSIKDKCKDCVYESKQNKLKHGLRKLDFNKKQIAFICNMANSYKYNLATKLEELHPELKKEEKD